MRLVVLTATIGQPIYGGRCWLENTILCFPLRPAALLLESIWKLEVGDGSNRGSSSGESRRSSADCGLSQMIPQHEASRIMDQKATPRRRFSVRRVAHPIGNNVVDLGDSETQLSKSEPRFLRRVFSESECQRILDSPDSQRALWGHWAAKESVFKSARKRDLGLPFSHAAFEIQCWQSAGEDTFLSEIIHQGNQYVVEVVQTTDWLHAVATPAPGFPGQAAFVKGVERCPVGLDPSIAVRAFAAGQLAVHLDCEPADLTITRTTPPLLLMNGQPTGIDLSLSHHGRWVAFAAGLLPISG